MYIIVSFFSLVLGERKANPQLLYPTLSSGPSPRSHSLQGHKLHLVMMDLTMPVLDGLHATELLRQYMFHGDTVPIVSVSSRPDERYPEEGGAVFTDKVIPCGFN